VGASLSYALTIIANALGFILAPFLLGRLGSTQMGIYETIGALAGYMAVLDFGVNSTITRYISKYRAEKQEERTQNLLAHCLILYSVLAAAVLAIGVLLWFNLEPIIKSLSAFQGKEGFDLTNIGTAKTMFLILLANIALSLPLRTFTAAMNGYELFTLPRLLNILRVLLRFVLILIFISLKFGVLTIAVIDLVANISILIINMLYVLLKMKQKVRLQKFELPFIKELMIFSLPIFLTMVYDQIFWKVDQLIIFGIMGFASAYVVSAVMRLVVIFMQFSTSISEVFLPRITQMVSKNASGDDLTDLMIRVGRVQFLILGLILTGYLLFGQNLLISWIGGRDAYTDSQMLNMYYIGCIILVPLTLPLIQNTGISMLVAKNKHHFRSTVYFIIAVLNIGLTIWLVKAFGIVGASIATAIALLLGNGIIINIYYSRAIELKIGRFFKDCVVRLGVPMAISAGFGYLIARFIAFPGSWGNLILCCVIYLVIYAAVMWLLGMNSYEKDMVRRAAARFTRKKGE
jgi:O-antigen/teichoic acid export membrane protein